MRENYSKVLTECASSYSNGSNTKIMSPAVYGSELAETPTLYMKTPIEEALFPPISRKSLHMVNDDNSEYSKHTRNSLPNSIASSPIKFPTIDRSKSTSVASITGVSTNGSRNRSLSKNRDRRGLCRSPSCPSHFDMHRDFHKELTETDYSLFRRERQETGDQINSGSQNGNGNDDKNKLPDIFTKDCNNKKSQKLHKTSSQKELLPIHSERSLDRSNNLGIRRTDSYQQVYPEFGTLTSRDNSEQRTNIQTAALLLPLRENGRMDGTNKKKKKHRSRHRNTQDESTENTHRSINKSPVRHLSKENIDALEAIAMENSVIDETGQLSPRAFKINSEKTVQQWLQGGSPHKQGQVKA